MKNIKWSKKRYILKWKLAEELSNKMHDMPSENYNATRGRSFSRKKPFLFLTNLLRKKKIMEIDDIMFDREMNHRARSEPSGKCILTIQVDYL